MPILFFWDLRVQFRSVLSEEHALHITDFFVNIVAVGRACIVKNIECNRMSFALQLRHDTVFLFPAALNTNIVLCDALQHIDTLAYINDVVIK